MAKRIKYHPTDAKILTGLSNLLGDFGPAIETVSDQNSAPNQAQAVINKFGGARALMDALKAAGYEINLATVYRWTYKRGGKSRGTGGWIPIAAWDAVLEAARLAGVVLDSNQFDPRLAARTTQNVRTPLYIWKMKREKRRRAGF